VGGQRAAPWGRRHPHERDVGCARVTSGPTKWVLTKGPLFTALYLRSALLDYCTEGILHLNQSGISINQPSAVGRRPRCPRSQLRLRLPIAITKILYPATDAEPQGCITPSCTGLKVARTCHCRMQKVPQKHANASLPTTRREGSLAERWLAPGFLHSRRGNNGGRSSSWKDGAPVGHSISLPLLIYPTWGIPRITVLRFAQRRFLSNAALRCVPASDPAAGLTDRLSPMGVQYL
jgi:hypothetical protein